MKIENTDSTGLFGSLILGIAFKMNFSIMPPFPCTPLNALFSAPGTQAGGGGLGNGAPESRMYLNVKEPSNPWSLGSWITMISSCSEIVSSSFSLQLKKLH